MANEPVSTCALAGEDLGVAQMTLTKEIEAALREIVAAGEEAKRQLEAGFTVEPAKSSAQRFK